MLIPEYDIKFLIRFHEAMAAELKILHSAPYHPDVHVSEGQLLTSFYEALVEKIEQEVLRSWESQAE